MTSTPRSSSGCTHSQSIENDELWRYAADFKTLTGKQIGVKLTWLGEAATCGQL